MSARTSLKFAYHTTWLHLPRFFISGTAFDQQHQFTPHPPSSSPCRTASKMSFNAKPFIKPEERFSIEEGASDGKAVLQKGGSPADEREMSRMGKKQELRVSRRVRQVESVLTSQSVTSSSSA